MSEQTWCVTEECRQDHNSKHLLVKMKAITSIATVTGPSISFCNTEIGRPIYQLLNNSHYILKDVRTN